MRGYLALRWLMPDTVVSRLPRPPPPNVQSTIMARKLDQRMSAYSRIASGVAIAYPALPTSSDGLMREGQREPMARADAVAGPPIFALDAIRSCGSVRQRIASSAPHRVVASAPRAAVPNPITTLKCVAYRIVRKPRSGGPPATTACGGKACAVEPVAPALRALRLQAGWASGAREG